MKSSLPSLGAGFLLCLLPLLPQAGQEPQEPEQDPARALEAAFEEQGIRLDLEHSTCSFPATVCVREDLLEYLIVTDYGASHESLFATSVTPSILNTALMALGAEAGKNAEWVEKDPMPSDEQLARGANPYDVVLPTGTGFSIHVAWREEGEDYLFRLEDLVGNLRTGRSMKRHEFVFLGSRLIPRREGGEELVFAADRDGNVLNLSFFRAGHTLLTAALEDSVFETIWVGNRYLVPERGTPVQVLLSRSELDPMPALVSELLDEMETEGELVEPK